jgi:RNA polymerase sigma factor (TIGR02999 family)
MSEVTQLLEAMDRGEPKAAEELLPLVYEELRRLAHQKMAQENPGQTIQATELVHEAWLRLLGRDQEHYEGRRHFFLAAAEAMRRILVDRARRKQRLKRGEGQKPVDLEAVEVPVEPDDDNLLLVHEALERFSARDAQKAQIVKLRYFAGLSRKDVAEVLNLSEKTVTRHWLYAKAWLCDEIQRMQSD